MRDGGGCWKRLLLRSLPCMASHASYKRTLPTPWRKVHQHVLSSMSPTGLMHRASGCRACMAATPVRLQHWIII